jgi:hypothetical protein
MEIVSIAIQHSSKSLDPLVEDVSQFKPLNLVQERLNAVKKIRWPGELLFC